jgi:hypothetical protein
VLAVINDCESPDVDLERWLASLTPAAADDLRRIINALASAPTRFARLASTERTRLEKHGPGRPTR